MDNKDKIETKPLPDPTLVGKNEFKKSGVTRTRILEAAIECLATIGYNATSTTTVAKTAGLTRAAMLYHFPNRLALIEAVVYYVTRRRAEMQHEGHSKLRHDETFRYRALDTNWEQLQTREFFAFSELAMASRTDEELAAVFKPAMESYDHARQDVSYQVAEPEISNTPGFDLRRDLARFALEGLALQDGITFNTEQRTAELKWFLKLLFDPDISSPMIDKARELALKELAERRSPNERDENDE